MTRYEGREISRHRDTDLDKGDVGFTPWSQVEPTIAKTRFYLESVICWAKHKQTNIKAPNNKQVIDVTIEGTGGQFTISIIEDLDVFDHLMGEIERIENGAD